VGDFVAEFCQISENLPSELDAAMMEESLDA
jgi:hypothetical protein